MSQIPDGVKTVGIFYSKNCTFAENNFMSVIKPILND